MHKRWIEQIIKQTLTRVPAAVLLGPRQVGKTTLAYSMAEKMDAIYLDLESPEDTIKLSNPFEFFSLHPNKLIILDEIQRAPDLFNILRGVIDKNRRAGRANGQFLLLGSASMSLMQQSSESLAGRVSFIDMAGFNLLELPQQLSSTVQSLWLRGGFPDSYLARSDQESMLWLEDLIRTYLERDVPQAGYKIPATRLRRLWTMLAHLQGETVNLSTLGGNLEVDGKTIRNYLDLLTNLLLINRLDPWYANVKKRLVKSPRYYIRDSGILHRLLGITDFESLLSNPIIGKSWEGMVIENILSLLSPHVGRYFYRTAAGAEIDLVLEFSPKQRWAIEIKAGHTPKVSPGFYNGCEDICATDRFIVYGGDDEFPGNKGCTIISLERMLQKIAALR